MCDICVQTCCHDIHAGGQGPTFKSQFSPVGSGDRTLAIKCAWQAAVYALSLLAVLLNWVLLELPWLPLYGLEYMGVTTLEKWRGVTYGMVCWLCRSLHIIHVTLTCDREWWVTAGVTSQAEQLQTFPECRPWLSWVPASSSVRDLLFEGWDGLAGQVLPSVTT